MSAIDDSQSDLRPFPVDSNDGSSQPDGYGSIEQDERAFRRPRSDTMSTIRSGIEIVRENMDRWKFLYLILASLFIYLSFIAAFAPRTSLARDLRRFHSARMTQSEVYRIFLDTLLYENKAEQHHDAISRSNGTSYIKNYLIDLGFEIKNDSYYAWVNTPVKQQVRVIQDDEVIYQAKLKEDLTGVSHNAFHGYSKDGKLTARFVYCNYCTIEDYTKLVNDKIDIEGKVHICKYGINAPGNKLKNAELYGSTGVLIFTDINEIPNMPVNYGDINSSETNSYDDAIQRDTVRFGSDIFGDPTTPGYAALYPDTERMNPNDYMPSIPSLPISYRDASKLLDMLHAKGSFWVSNDGVNSAKLFSGPSDPNTEVQLVNRQEYGVQQIDNIIVEIPGILSENDILIGAHRDGFPIGNGTSSMSSHSGIAVLLEFARGISKLRKKGWKPLRTIKFVLWDGLHNSQLGSSSFGTRYATSLKRDSLLYVNLDNAIAGQYFNVKANPMLISAITEASKNIDYKKNEDWSLFQEWYNTSNAKVDSLEGVNDYSVFQFYLGIPVVNFSFNSRTSNQPQFPINTGYDNKEWLIRYVDPEFLLHNTLSRFLGMFVLMVSETELSYYNPHPFFKHLNIQFDKVKRFAEKTFSRNEKLLYKLDSLGKLIKDIADYDSKYYERRNKEVADGVSSELPIWAFVRKYRVFLSLIRANKKLREIGKVFLTNNGIEGRPLMKSSLFAPNLENSTEIMMFPGLLEATKQKDAQKAMKSLIVLEAQFLNVRYLLL